MTYFVGVDLGGTKILAAVADNEGTILATAREETRAHEGGDAAVDRIGQAVEQACWACGLELSDIEAVGVGSPGPLDLDKGLVVNTPNLPWGVYPLRDKLSARLEGLPVLIDNDCKVGGLGEYRFGAGKGSRSMVYFGVGTGIGGCVIVDGKIQYGASGNASEIGHTIVHLNGPLCGCGARGCVEAIASGSGLTRLAREAAAAGRLPGVVTLAGSPDKVDAGMLAKAAAAGDQGAVSLWEYGITALGAAVANVMNILSPDVVVLGGGVVEKNGQRYVEAVAAVARGLALGSNATASRIEQADLGEESAMRGAVALALSGWRAG